MTRAVLKWVLAEKMTEHLGYGKPDALAAGRGGNSVTGKRLLTEIGGIGANPGRKSS